MVDRQSWSKWITDWIVSFADAFGSVIREIEKLNETELQLGRGGKSWHDVYKNSAYIFVGLWKFSPLCFFPLTVWKGGLNYGLTEGDVLTIFSQLVCNALTESRSH